MILAKSSTFVSQSGEQASSKVAWVYPKDVSQVILHIREEPPAGRIPTAQLPPDVSQVSQSSLKRNNVSTPYDDGLEQTPILTAVNVIMPKTSKYILEHLLIIDSWSETPSRGRVQGIGKRQVMFSMPNHSRDLDNRKSEAELQWDSLNNRTLVA